MRIDDPAVIDILRRSLVARIATLSSTGRPSINPLYFIYRDGHVWLGTSDWTLAARNVTADPRVSVLFNVERDRSDRRVLRVNGRASVKTDRAVMDSYNSRVARKYILTPRGILHYARNFRLLLPMHYYHDQSKEKGLPCIIDLIPEQAEFLS